MTQDSLEESFAPKITNGTSEPADIAKLKMPEPRSELESVPINKEPSLSSVLNSAERVMVRFASILARI